MHHAPQKHYAPTYQISAKSDKPTRLSYWWFNKFLGPFFRIF